MILTSSPNVSSQQLEVDHAASWAKANNLRASEGKYKEVVYYNRHSREQVRTASPL
jgi:hypothetical protein